MFFDQVSDSNILIMSTREIYNLSNKPGVFLFEDGRKNAGMLVPHYNIRRGKIEYYFVPSSRIEDYQKARENFVRDAYRYYGNLIDESAIHALIE